MKLVRVAMFYLTPAQEGWTSWRFNFGPVTVETMPFGKAPRVDKAQRLLVVAQTVVTTLPVVDGDGLVDVPESERRECEHALEVSANVISVLTKASRRITSAWPPVAFVPESDDDRSLLATARGIRYRHRSYVGTNSQIELTPELLRALVDRFDGLSSVATFFSTDTALGRYREAARFFEMAFALSTTDLDKKLSQFLLSGPFGYTRAEVKSWLLHRHGAVHGDGKKIASFTWESDVRPFIQRIEQAILDVLFNKTVWHNNSQERRNVWSPAFGTPSAGTDLFAARGAAGALEFQLLDTWGTFPMDLSSLDTAPADWWCEFVQSPG